MVEGRTAKESRCRWMQPGRKDGTETERTLWRGSARPTTYSQIYLMYLRIKIVKSCVQLQTIHFLAIVQWKISVTKPTMVCGWTKRRDEETQERVKLKT